MPSANLFSSAICHLLLASAVPGASAGQQQCQGHSPQPGVSSFLGASLDYDLADRICCHNHVYAEPSGYLAQPGVDLFGRLDPDAETVFYDSVCGIPLFVAPRGRSFDDFREESLAHGWPSFRPSEIVSENVIIHDDGRMESKCLTHLGHNLPSGGADRYCIDLVCVAGAPLSVDDERSGTLALIDDGEVIFHDEFDASSYTSSAETFSGKFNDRSMVAIAAAAVAVVLVLAVGVGVAWRCGKKMGSRGEKQELFDRAGRDIA